jgi:hypothetical protein
MSERGWLPVSILILCCLGNRGTAIEDAGKSAAPRWLSDWEEGRKAARASGKPLFVVFRCEH